MIYRHIRQRIRRTHPGIHQKLYPSIPSQGRLTYCSYFLWAMKSNKKVIRYKLQSITANRKMENQTGTFVNTLALRKMKTHQTSSILVGLSNLKTKESLYILQF